MKQKYTIFMSLILSGYWGFIFDVFRFRTLQARMLAPFIGKPDYEVQKPFAIYISSFCIWMKLLKRLNVAVDPEMKYYVAAIGNAALNDIKTSEVENLIEKYEYMFRSMNYESKPFDSLLKMFTLTRKIDVSKLSTARIKKLCYTVSLLDVLYSHNALYGDLGRVKNVSDPSVKIVDEEYANQFKIVKEIHDA